MNIRALRYFTTLAREQHFARAADLCGVSQPTLSAALASLEVQLGKRLIDRDRRYVGLTSEGKAMLPWAQQLLAAHDALLQSVELVSGPLSGELHIGVIPAALPVAGRIGTFLLDAHPQLSLSVRSLSSKQIVQSLNAFELHAGLTYFDDTDHPGLIVEPVAAERNYLVTPAPLPLSAHARGDAEVSWATAATHPLCLLHGGMQNRRIIDAVFADHGLTISPRATADSFVALLSMVRTGQFATIIPESYRFLLDGVDWAIFAPLAQHPLIKRIGLAVLDREPIGALPMAAMQSVRRFNGSDR